MSGYITAAIKTQEYTYSDMHIAHYGITTAVNEAATTEAAF